MKLKCPRCKRIIKEFEPTEAEKAFFEEEELKKGEAEHWKPCSTCAEVANKPHWSL